MCGCSKTATVRGHTHTHTQPPWRAVGTSKTQETASLGLSALSGVPSFSGIDYCWGGLAPCIPPPPTHLGHTAFAVSLASRAL